VCLGSWGIKKRVRACLELGARVVGWKEARKGTDVDKCDVQAEKRKLGWVASRRSRSLELSVSISRLPLREASLCRIHSSVPGLEKQKGMEMKGTYFALPLD
jgi:hypothetical protein